jgi:3-isopropylmalate/(R)-2-methylmalate dehydratase large subunit
MTGRTLFDKLWQSHVVLEEPNGPALIYVDRHPVYEVTSPQAFEAIRLAGRRPWRAASVLATSDHNVPTTNRKCGIEDSLSRAQVETLDRNCKQFGITQFGL